MYHVTVRHRGEAWMSKRTAHDVERLHSDLLGENPGLAAAVDFRPPVLHKKAERRGSQLGARVGARLAKGKRQGQGPAQGQSPGLADHLVEENRRRVEQYLQTLTR
jgi:hypothetical protein